MRRAAWRRLLARAGLYAGVLALTAFAGMPFYWMALTAIKRNRDLYVGAFERSHVPWILNAPPTLEHVKLLFQGTDFPRWALNSLVVLAVVALVTVVMAVPAGYSLARLAGRWGERMGMR